MTAIVYEVVNSINGKRYVGMTTQQLADRRKCHEREALRGIYPWKFHRALRKYGIEAFQWTEIARLPSAAEAKIAERIQIALTGPAYNMTPGGDGGSFQRGRKRSAETRAKISEANRRRRGEKRARRPPATDVTRAKLSAAAKRVNSIAHARPFTLAPEAVAKRAASNRGGKRSAETRARMSEAAKKREAAKRERCRFSF